MVLIEKEHRASAVIPCRYIYKLYQCSGKENRENGIFRLEDLVVGIYRLPSGELEKTIDVLSILGDGPYEIISLDLSALIEEGECFLLVKVAEKGSKSSDESYLKIHIRDESYTVVSRGSLPDYADTPRSAAGKEFAYYLNEKGIIDASITELSWIPGTTVIGMPGWVYQQLQLNVGKIEAEEYVFFVFSEGKERN